jgi:hypothetical protein
MLAPFRIFDGAIGAPGMSFNNETSLGIWRSATGTMQLTSTGVNQLTVAANGLTSYTRLSIMNGIGIIFKHPGYKTWQFVDYQGSLWIQPSATPDAEDFVGSKAITLNADTGNLNISGGLTIAGALSIGATTINGNCSITGGLGVSGVTNLYGATAVLNGAGFTLSGGGTLTVVGCIGSIAAASASSKLEVRANSSVEASYITFHRPSAFAAQFGLDTDNNWKVGGYSYGAVSYKILHEANSFAIDGAGNLNAARIVQANCFVGKLTALGAFNGGLDFRTAQSVSMNAGSVVNGMTMVAGEIARIEVVGSGAITINQANSRWAAGSPVWGSVVTLVSIFFDGSSYFMATQTHTT